MNQNGLHKRTQQQTSTQKWVSSLMLQEAYQHLLHSVLSTILKEDSNVEGIFTRTKTHEI